MFYVAAAALKNNLFYNVKLIGREEIIIMDREANVNVKNLKTGPQMRKVTLHRMMMEQTTKIDQDSKYQVILKYNRNIQNSMKCIPPNCKASKQLVT